MDRERIRKALAQTYCMDRHSHKVLDPDLIEDMTDKIIAEEGCTCKEPKKKKL